MGIVDTLRDWQERHRRFVKRVHAFRIPLSPTGRRIAQVVYFSIPVIGGYFIMDWATSKAREELKFDEAAASEDKGRVMAAMRMAPAPPAPSSPSPPPCGSRGTGEQQRQIDLQNQRLQSYLDSLANKKGNDSGGGR